MPKSDFLLAITQLSAEKNLPPDVVLAAVEAALVSAYRKDNFAANQNISVKINQNSGKVQVFADKTVVERPADPRAEISLNEARRIKKDIELGQTVTVEATPDNAGRIAAQTAKQVILQRLHEAEHSAIFEEYSGREGDIVNGVVQRLEPRQIFIDLGRIEAILPITEQVQSERYRIGQRLKASIREVAQSTRGPRVVLSRTHPDLVRRLFEMEVPEIFNGVVEVKAIAREAGSRSKVAVAAKQDGIDPVGCCVGLRGIRIQNIVTELNGEKIDVVAWSSDPATFIANALNPAQIISVELRDESATVVVPDRQLSLAIGKEGQNVRLAAKLTGWRIDIKSTSAVEAEKAAAAAALAAITAKAAAAVAAEAPVVEAPEPVLAGAKAETIETVPEVAPVTRSPAFTPPPAAAPRTPRIRFAEEILTPAPATTPAKVNKKQKKKGTQGREREDERIGARKPRRDEIDVSPDEEEEF